MGFFRWLADILEPCDSRGGYIPECVGHGTPPKCTPILTQPPPPVASKEEIHVVVVVRPCLGKKSRPAPPPPSVTARPPMSGKFKPDGEA